MHGSTRARECIAGEPGPISSHPAYGHPSKTKLQEQRLADLRKWACDRGLMRPDYSNQGAMKQETE
jgi:hypothetical protein